MDKTYLLIDLHTILNIVVQGSCIDLKIQSMILGQLC